MKRYYEALFLSYRPLTAVFHSFEIQIALIQYSGRSKHAWAFSETAKKAFGQNVRELEKPLSVSFVKDNKLSLMYVFPKNKVTYLGARLANSRENVVANA